MKEALDFFLNNEEVHQSADAPDEAIDYIFMLDAEELLFLAEEWNKRDDEWKSAISYLIGNLQLKDAKPILLKALTDSKPDILIEALLSVHQTITETENSNVEIPEEIKQASVKAFEKVEITYPELIELKRLLENS